MSYKRAFWGVVLVLIGILIIMRNLGIVLVDWGDIRYLWPVLFILWGISVLPVKDYVKFTVSLAIIAIAFWYLQSPDFQEIKQGQHEQWIWKWHNSDNWHHQEYNEQVFTEPFDTSVHVAALHFSGGAGTFRVFPGSDELVDVAASGAASFSMTSSDTEEGREINVGMKDLSGKDEGNRMELALHEVPSWNLDIDCGAADLEMDLASLHVSELRVDAGAADINIELGDKAPETHVMLHAGAADVTLRIPESAGCEIRVSSILADRSLEGFERIDRGVYRTNDYDTAEKRILIDAEVAVANLTVKRY